MFLGKVRNPLFHCLNKNTSLLSYFSSLPILNCFFSFFFLLCCFSSLSKSFSFLLLSLTLFFFCLLFFHLSLCSFLLALSFLFSLSLLLVCCIFSLSKYSLILLSHSSYPLSISVIISLFPTSLIDFIFHLCFSTQFNFIFFFYLSISILIFSLSLFYIPLLLLSSTHFFSLDLLLI
ncbi:unnamed protein product [Acanthosepion pharaonis]|uniref:Uncharacterized protein n=1 Tax=Acanthosepion pharaonis TaxID=158019 RepID=A0A812BZ69_ACAPH|nr:unnamed protein product [Sepia pharaonis]